MTRRKPRGLRPEEEELWNKVRNSATPLHKNTKTILQDALHQPRRHKEAEPKRPVPEFRVGQAANSVPKRHVLSPSVSKDLSSAPLQMDHKHFGRMKRGKLSPDGRIDLHGMTIAQAHPALMSFILDAYADQKRLVLVITGKGKSKPDEGPIPVRMGVLRHNVPNWLRAAPLGPLVLQITEAHAKHGGSGAFYVYLRRHR